MPAATNDKGTKWRIVLMLRVSLGTIANPTTSMISKMIKARQIRPNARNIGNIRKFKLKDRRTRLVVL
jgi:hypothetical protein